MNVITTAKQLWHAKLHLQQGQWSAHAYLTELTWLLGFKFAPLLENFLPLHLRWEKLIRQPLATQLHYYQTMLRQVAQLDDPYFSGIYAQARTQLQNVEQLQHLITTLTVLDHVLPEDLGEIYESLLQEAARENSEYIIPPRALVDMMVILTQPQAGELVLDPYAGVGNLLIAADQYMTVMCEEDYDLVNLQTIIGMVPQLEHHRIALMNCLLHQVVTEEKLPITWDDGLLSENELPKTEVVLSNLLCQKTENDYEKCAELIQYSAQQLKAGGRAALIVPDELLQLSYFQNEICPNLLETNILHTVLRLPEGIFYPHEIKATMLFFRRGITVEDTTQHTYFYDLRHQLPTFGAQRLLTREHLIKFEMAYGDDPQGQSMRNNQQWFCLSREELAQCHDNLNIFECEIKNNATQPNYSLLNVLDNAVNELEDVQRILKDKYS